MLDEPKGTASPKPFFVLAHTFFFRNILIVMKKHYFCKVLIHAVPSAGLCHEGWRRLYRLNMEIDLRGVGGRDTMLKRH